QPDPDQERNHASHPDVAQELGGFRILRLDPRCNRAEKKVKEDHHADAHETRNHAVLDLLVALLFGSHALLALALLFTQEHLGDPGLAPIEAPPALARQDFTHAVEVRTALFAKLEVLVGLDSALGTKHLVLLNSGSRRLESMPPP